MGHLLQSPTLFISGMCFLCCLGKLRGVRFTRALSESALDARIVTALGFEGARRSHASEVWAQFSKNAKICLVFDLCFQLVALFLPRSCPFLATFLRCNISGVAMQLLPFFSALSAQGLPSLRAKVAFYRRPTEGLQTRSVVAMGTRSSVEVSGTKTARSPSFVLQDGRPD